MNSLWSRPKFIVNMERRHFSLLSWGFAILFGVLALLTTFHAWSLRPSEDLCGRRWSIWSPIDRGMQQTWRLFPDLTLFSKSEFFGPEIQDVDSAWEKFLLSKYSKRQFLHNIHIISHHRISNRDTKIPTLRSETFRRCTLRPPSPNGGVSPRNSRSVRST
jgi:hypothetical protein